MLRRSTFRRTIAWKDGIVGRLNGGVTGLLKKGGRQGGHRRGRFVDGKTVDVETETGLQRIRAEAIVIATGSGAGRASRPSLRRKRHFLDPGSGADGRAADARVIGGGYIGLELGTAFAKLGSKVTVLEALAGSCRNTTPTSQKPVMKRLGELGVEVFTRTKAKRLSADRRGLLGRGERPRLRGPGGEGSRHRRPPAGDRRLGA